MEKTQNMVKKYTEKEMKEFNRRLQRQREIQNRKDKDFFEGIRQDNLIKELRIKTKPIIDKLKNGK